MNNSPAQYIQQTLEKAFQPELLEVRDVSHQHQGHPGAKEGKHFVLNIKSKHFAQMNLLASHRLIYQALGSLSKHGIHALSIKIIR